MLGNDEDGNGVDSRVTDLSFSATQDYGEETDDETKVLFKVWLNERMSPTLLPYATETVENVLELISNQMALMEEQKADTSQVAYISCLYEMELERLKFVLSSYHRCRLEKIQNFWVHWLHLSYEERAGLFHQAEEKFLQGYGQAKRKALYESVLQHLPPPLAVLPGPDQCRRPEMNNFVICQVLEDLGKVQVDSGVLIDMLEDDIYVIKYAAADSLLKASKLCLL